MVKEHPHRVGVIVGAGMGGMVMGEREITQLYQHQRPHRVHPNFIPVITLNSASGIVAMAHGAKGPNFTISTACSSIKHKDMPEDIEYESQYHYKHTACVKNMHGFTNKYDGNLFEIFTFNSGGCTSNIATITRLCSLLFRSGVKIDVIVKELKKNLCPACVELQKQGRTDISKSCGNAIAEMIEEAYKKEVVKVDTSKWLICPSCGARGMNPAEKCAVCKECGFSKCD
jgi:hypothetical protein